MKDRLCSWLILVGCFITGFGLFDVLALVSMSTDPESTLDAIRKNGLVIRASAALILGMMSVGVGIIRDTILTRPKQ